MAVGLPAREGQETILDQVQNLARQVGQALDSIARIEGQLPQERESMREWVDDVKNDMELMSNPRIEALINSIVRVQDSEFMLEALNKQLEVKSEMLREKVETNAMQLVNLVGDGKTILRGKDGAVAVNVQTTYKVTAWDAVRAYDYCQTSQALGRYVIHTVAEKELQEAIRSGKVVVSDEYADIYRWQEKNTARLTNDALKTLAVHVKEE